MLPLLIDADLEWWLRVYGERVLPAKYMNKDLWMVENWDLVRIDDNPPPEQILRGAKLSRSHALELNQVLKGLDGTVLKDGIHVWKFMGRRHFRRQGEQNHYGCVVRN